MLLALIRWWSRRPLWLLHLWGGWIGLAGYALSPRYRARFDANAARAGIDAVRRREAARQSGRMVAEIPWLWMRPVGRPLEPAPQWRGAERIDAALASGRGLVLLSPHIGCFELVAQAYAERFGARQPMTALYRPARQAWLRELEETARHRPGLLTAPASLAGVRQLMRALRQGQTVGMLPDQVPPEGMGVWAPFFGAPAYTMTLATRLMQQTGATALIAIAQRLPRGAGFVVGVHELPEPLPAPGGDEQAHQVACATAMNRAMEYAVRLMPEQYLWGYDRYKQPRGGV